MKDLMKKATSSPVPSSKDPSHVLGSGLSPSASASPRPSNPNRPAGPSDFAPFSSLVSSSRRPGAYGGDTVASPNSGDSFSSEHLAATDKMKDLSPVPSSKDPSHVLGSGPSPSASASPRPSNPNRAAGPSDFAPFSSLVSSSRRPGAYGGTAASPSCGDALGARSRAAAYLACSPPAAAVEVVKKMLGNLLKEPWNDKYRRVSLGRIKESVADRGERGLELLEAVGFTIGDESGELFAVMDETPNDVRLGRIRQAVLLLERSQLSAEAADKESCPSGVEDQKEVKKIAGRQDTNLLDPKNAPLLLFQYNSNQPDEDELDGSGSQDSYENDDDEGSGEPTDAFFFYSINKKILQSRTMDDLEGYFYWVTPQGWFLLLHRDSHATYIWNPFTRQRISLPMDEEEFLTKNTTRCLLSHKPSDPKCVVLVINCRDTVLWYCHPEGNQWFKHTYESGMLAERRGAVIGGMQILTAVRGEFWTYFSGNLVILQFLPDPVFTKVPVENKEHRMHPCVDRFFLESCGELFRLDCCRIGFTSRVAYVRVHRLDMAEKVWLEVDSLGDRVFFVNPTYFGASLSAQKLGLKGNCIYYLRLGDKALYVQDMERGSTAMHNVGEDLLDDVAPEIVMPPS